MFLGMKPISRRTSKTDISLRYLEWPGKGSPVLLLHGLTVCAEYWSPTAQIIAREHRVISVDLRGHGHSDKPDWGYDYQTVSKDVEQLCDEINVEGGLLAGHSWGASVALCLAASNPDRFSHLALVDGGFGGRRRIPKKPQDYDAMMAPIEVYTNRETYLSAAGSGIVEVMNAEVEEILMSSVIVNPDGTISERLTRENNARILQSMGDLDTKELYSAISIPVLFVGALSGSSQRSEANDRKRQAVRGAIELVGNGQECWFANTAHDIQIHRPIELANELEAFVRGGR